MGPDGEIFSRGPDLCLGYTDDELTARAFDDDGWYRTGDVGVLDDDGYLTITDRKADVIIRGGENISALEVEEVLLGMPAVAEAVVVAAPDDRLGERAAAVLRIRDGHDMPTLDEVRDTLQGGRRGHPEVAGGAAPGRRLPAHRERQGAEVSWCGEQHCVAQLVRIGFSQEEKECSMGQLSHRVDIPFPLFDADNHLYEPPEALTKYLPKEYKDVVQYVRGQRPHQDRAEGSDQQLHPEPHLLGGRQARRLGGVLQVRQPRRQEQARALRRADAGHPGVLRARVRGWRRWTSWASTAR